MNRLITITCLTFTLFAHCAMANDLDSKLYEQSQDKHITQSGKVLFEQICASCHNKDLSGASGFNLKDAEWVHGSRPSQILHNVKSGFMNAGMPGFAGVFSGPELESIIAYVLSKREGWSDLTFKLYQLEDENDKNITEQKLVKSGVLPKGLADFSIPEIQHYFIEFEGDFYAPKDVDTQIWLEWGFPHELSMYVDDELVNRGGQPWYPTWRLKRGKQHLKLTYRSGTTKPNQRNLVLLGTNLDMTIKMFAVSSRAKVILEDKKFEVTANDKIVIQRKRINNLPPSTISVGFPVKLNYGFNTKSCAIVALWQGDLLNIGPNIAGRGEDPSLPLGQLVFRSGQQISHNHLEGNCRYTGYQLDQGNPVFSYQIGHQGYSLEVKPSGSDTLSFNYKTDSKASSAFILPESDKLTWSSNDQVLLHGNNMLTPNNNREIVISATIKP
ncbi:cytochrome c [Psychrosphaera sp. F3M07]|uniref:c-type cytochrome n=1 Tax=Psychrosphaera sp. F3M07 TaxID=2841560 RepID=UPI001C094EF7|nr:cytochrome c [Psychrosphaera sp. F3M07]MBU2918833.1 cytochrome c [Psychrosphaera sp. F3M07]